MMRKLIFSLFVILVLATGLPPAYSQKFPPGMDYLINKPVTLFDWGIWKYNILEHDKTVAKLRKQLGKGEVTGGFGFSDNKLVAKFVVFEVQGDLEARCQDIWIKAKDLVMPKSPFRKRQMENFAHHIQFHFNNYGFELIDRPKTLGQSLANMYNIRVVVFKNKRDHIPVGFNEPYYYQNCDGHVFDDKPVLGKSSPAK